MFKQQEQKAKVLLFCEAFETWFVDVTGKVL
jgi:hypothetical protein